MAAASGRPVEFLEEHAAFGLPEASRIEADLARACPAVATVANAPLAIWSSSNVIDFVINLRTGGPHLKSLVNTVINERSIVCPSDQPGYRNFFLGSPSGTVDVRAIAGRLSEGSTDLTDADVASLASDTARQLDTTARSLDVANQSAGTPDRCARSANAPNRAGERPAAPSSGEQRRAGRRRSTAGGSRSSRQRAGRAGARRRPVCRPVRGRAAAGPATGIAAR